MTTEKRDRWMDGTFKQKAPAPNHYHAGTWNTPRPGLDCDDCRETAPEMIHYRTLKGPADFRRR